MMNNIKLKSFLILSFSILINFCSGVPCPSGCTCYQNTVRCIRLHLSSIPSVSTNTAILDLRYNQIREIPSNAFEGLSQLHTIFLNENQIGLIKENAFNGLTSLKYLYLNNNRISKISSNIFQGLQELQNLYLENNDIWELNAKSFSNLPELNRLFLSNNKITIIPQGSFSNLPNLRRLRLDSNPIECDCGLYSLLKQYKETKQQNFIELQCASPSDLAHKTFTSLEDNDFHCEKPKIIEEPHDMTITSGELVELPCKATGDPQPQIVWMQNSFEIPNENSHYEMFDDGRILRINPATKDDTGTYECVAKNPVGEVKSRQIRMVVNDDNNYNRNEINLQSPRFILLPYDMTANTRESVVLHCLASGNPTPQINWYFNNRKLQLSTNKARIHSNGSLIIINPTKSNDGVYTCEASNSLGTIRTNSKVQIIEQPNFILAPQNQTIKSGTKLILECDADGDPLPRISWQRNGIEIRKKLEISATDRISLQNENTELHIEHAKESDSGLYTCIAENINGKIEAHAEVVVENSWGPPKLVFEPYDIDVLPGTTIELPCKGEGDPAPQVKWRKDGRIITEIPGRYHINAVGNLYIKNVTDFDAGRYECSITNNYGRATASGVVTVRNNDVLAPGDRFVRIAFSEASREIDSAINNTIQMLFSNSSQSSTRNHGDLFRIFRFPDAPTRQIARAAEIYERTLVNIRKHIEIGKNLTVNTSDWSHKELLSKEHLRLIAELSGCMEHRRTPNCTDMCFHAKYRTIDGTCNNLNNPTWGASLIGFRRLIRPEYENGFSMPIGWTKNKLYYGYPKPSARLVSTSLIRTENITPDERITHMVMQWGQFLDHDLDHAIPSISSESWDGVDCKKTCEYAAPCFPIEVPPNDPRVKNRRCIDLVRSSAICGSGMTSIFFDSIQPREQINQLTSFIDASQVYGYSEELSVELRNLTEESGLLRTGVHFPNQKDMLPFAAPQYGIDCRRDVEESNVNCFAAGDIRVNEQVGLLAMHIIWMREHNRIATKLKALNPHWDGDTLFEEARKIVGAQMQHITFKHWLPIILGPEGMNMMGEYKGYDPNINPTISNEFATAALRFGHTIINPILHRLNESYQPIPQGHLELHRAFFSPWRLVYEGGVDPLLRGMFSVPAKLKTPNQNLNMELTEKLFHNAHAVALDLAAINIQRAREHGIPEYNKYRELCNMSVAEKFDDLKNEISSPEIRSKLKELYGHPSNIDLWVGGILEDQVEGGKVGPLFRCILVNQFKKLRDGDRFYYENPSVFLPEQLQQIKQTSLGRVLCDNGDNITEATDDIFILPQHQGGYKKCWDIPGINLYFWQDCGTCSNSLSPLLKSYVPQTYHKPHNRNKRSIESNSVYNTSEILHNIHNDDDEEVEKLLDMNEERVSGLEELINIFQKELKKMKKKMKKLEQTCSQIQNKPHHHCQDTSGNRRLNNEVWNQDECTKCQCKNAQITCITEHCGSITCPENATPIKYPGECCSQCPKNLTTVIETDDNL